MNDDVENMIADRERRKTTHAFLGAAGSFLLLVLLAGVALVAQSCSEVGSVSQPAPTARVSGRVEPGSRRRARLDRSAPPPSNARTVTKGVPERGGRTTSPGGDATETGAPAEPTPGRTHAAHRCAQAPRNRSG